tara:strand:- start:3568 stop:4110 length:543 start_codon:yes stop_codon:yes gene_type:complete
MPIKIKLSSTDSTPPAPPQATIELKVTETLDGNLLIDDHEHMDILIVPAEKKILSLPKPHSDRDVFEYQKELMDSLFKGGVTAAAFPQGGLSFGVVETTYPDSPTINSLQAVLYQISEYFKNTARQEEISDEYDENIEDNFTDPPSDETTAYGEIPPHQDTPGANWVDPTYSFAGAGYLY